MNDVVQPHAVIVLYEQALATAQAEIAARDERIADTQAARDRFSALWNTACVSIRSQRYEIDTLSARVRELEAALFDMLSGWRYIRNMYGDLYGVGWDRAQDKAEKALAATAPEPATDHVGDANKMVPAQPDVRDDQLVLDLLVVLDCLEDAETRHGVQVPNGRGDDFWYALNRLHNAVAVDLSKGVPLGAIQDPAIRDAVRRVFDGQQPDVRALERAVVSQAIEYGHMLLSEDEPTGKSIKARLEARKHLMALSCDLALAAAQQPGAAALERD